MPGDELAKTFRALLKATFEQEHKRTGLTRVAVADKLKAVGVPYGRTVVSKWLNGLECPPKEFAEAVCKELALSYTLDQIDRMWPETKWKSPQARSRRDSKSETHVMEKRDSGLPQMLHHVSIPVRDLQKSIEFYTTLLDTQLAKRPPFPFSGAWLVLPSGQEIHLVENAKASYRDAAAEIDPRDIHFALRVPDYRRAHNILRERGIEILPEPLFVDSHQLYFHDPDRHVIEINADYRANTSC